MKKIFILLGILILIPFKVNALEIENDFVEVAREIKYYKVTSYNHLDNSLLYANYLDNSVSEEISAQEYESVNTDIAPYNTVETTYKKMTTTILSNGSKYRYKVVLNWKNFPSTRSYDIIGLGHYPSVKLNGNLNFALNYSTNTGNYSSTSATFYTSNTGSSAIFKLPTGSLTSLSSTLYFDVTKNTDAIIITQKAYGDYSHAISAVTLSNAKKHTIGFNGIVLSNSVSKYFDSIDSAITTWNGNW